MSVYRQIEIPINSYKEKYPILAVTGPRQSGKTTLLKTLFPDYVYVNLENPDTRLFAETDPNGFLKQFASKVIFDEVQRVPSLFSYIQSAVDLTGEMGQYILSGSQNFQLLANITQSLAGRVALFKLLPFDNTELKTAGLLSDDYAQMLVKGCYPAIYDRGIPSKVYFANYIQTYVERDIVDLVNVRDIKNFRKFLSLCATRAGQLLNLNSLANECGISQPTAKSWLSLLESSYILYTLQPYHKNLSKRVVKTPKLYFYDTGLLAFLLKINDATKLKAMPIKGMLFENYVVTEFVKQDYHRYLQQEMWFWRDSAGHEVDLLVEDEATTNLYEVKATETVLPDLFKGLNYFEALAPELTGSKNLVYGGRQKQERSYGNVLPWDALASK